MLLTTMGNPRKVHIGINTADYYKHYRAKGGTVNKSLYSKIFKDYCKMMKDELFARREITLPNSFGRIRIVKWLPELSVDEEGNVVNKLPVNPKATHELWESNAEAKEKRILVRYRNTHTNGYVFKIKWNKGRIKFLGLFTFKPNKNFKTELGEKIIKENYDAFIQ